MNGPPMLVLRDTAPQVPEPVIDFIEHVPFFAEWSDYTPGHTVYWQNQSDADVLMVGIDDRNGSVVRVEHPARSDAAEVGVDPWSGVPVRAGRPRIDLVGWPEGETYREDPEVTSMQFRYTRKALRLGWGTESFGLRSGRCVFGFDAGLRLVSFGIVELAPPEYEHVRRTVVWSARWKGTAPDHRGAGLDQ